MFNSDVDLMILFFQKKTDTPQYILLRSSDDWCLNQLQFPAGQSGLFVSSENQLPQKVSSVDGCNPAENRHCV